MTMVEMIVNMDCQGCQRKVRKALQNLDGVESVVIDMKLQKVTVTGWVDQEKVLRRVRRTGKKADLWPFPNNPEVIEFTQQYSDMYTYHSYPATYFHVHVQQPDYNSHLELPGFGQRATTAFSDENVNACSIM